MANAPNDIVALDLKQFNMKGKQFHVFLMVCFFSRLAVGEVLKSKEGNEVVKALES